ncbi:mechanosensitive ion channel [Thiomicrorhabdus sp. ZW0627]|uniref:mechanosensitive ion channel family protein n=1 Tax=Thiomicrorhabdus sp. ZW0627 TaxID=3039774 RepID=UPI0024369536|nr:mechanosensitive ion channel domain-containing protein [Thiomicrorhabdus sp. ZW0627]MDG6773813.1 mechanosensitive ion channel [Thiomicrorhabdus sp. ZW0627]
MNFERIEQAWQTFLSELWLMVGEVDFYLQLLAVVVAGVFAWFVSSKSKALLDQRLQKTQRSERWFSQPVGVIKDLLWPVTTLLLLGFVQSVFEQSGYRFELIKFAFGLVLLATLFSSVHRHVNQLFVATMLKWVMLPMATLYLFGWLEPTVTYLKSLAFQVGDITLSVYAILRLLVLGSILFWLGRLSNQYGQQIIRNKQSLDVRSREVFAKLFEIALFVVIFLLLLNVVGINLTALAVFGGALGVGIGFGLQQIASNFISGLIILLDKSMAIGNYIELEDGKAGVLKKMGMRSSSLETYDGKMVVVPNERFITTTFTNWTHDDPRQRYTLEFSVAYDSDIPSIPDLILNAVKQHPQVLMEPERPDCEIIEFADSGVVFQLEYWIEGIDDGKNRVASDLLMIIWKTLHENQISIPFPQREVRILNEGSR